jgi:hypothetical protein
MAVTLAAFSRMGETMTIDYRTTAFHNDYADIRLSVRDIVRLLFGQTLRVQKSALVFTIVAR